MYNAGMNLATDTNFFSDMALPDAERRAKDAAALLIQRAPVGMVPTVAKHGAAPIVAANNNMQARGFKRAAGPSGATRMFNRAHIPANRGSRRMATSFLMGASTRNALMGTPVVSPLSLLQARVSPRKFALSRRAMEKTALQNWAAMRARASMVFGILAARANNVTRDMRDGEADWALARNMQARSWNMGLRYV